MKVGVNGAFQADSVDLGEFAARCEELGFESIWLPEHPVVPVHASRGPGGVEGAPIPDSYARMVDQMIGLSMVAASTSTLRLGTGVCLVPEHHPIDLAKRIATLDLYSGGRFVLGVGAGWSPEESAAMGANFGRRWAQTREAVAVMKTLWTQEEPEFHGEFYDFPPVRFFPKPAQTPHPPILLGGRSKYLFERIASWADGWIPIGIAPDDLRAGRAEIARLCESKGRDPDTVHVTVYGLSADSEAIDAFKAAGADRATIGVNPSSDADPYRRLEEAARAAGL